MVSQAWGEYGLHKGRDAARMRKGVVRLKFCHQTSPYADRAAQNAG